MKVANAKQGSAALPVGQPSEALQRQRPTEPVEHPIISFALERMARPEGWSGTEIEINGIKRGGVIVISGERAFDRVVALINDHCRPAAKSEGPVS